MASMYLVNSKKKNVTIKDNNFAKMIKSNSLFDSGKNTKIIKSNSLFDGTLVEKLPIKNGSVYLLQCSVRC